MDVINDKYNTINSNSASITTITITSQSTQSQLLKSQSINNNLNLNHHEDDSGIEQDSTILIRVCINEQNLQKVFKFNLDETVWLAKHKVLTNLARELKDGINYGFYLPSYQGRAGKFLDDCRLLREYPLNNGQLATLEFKYKKRVYKFMKLNPKEIKTLNTKANLKRFLDYVRTNQTNRVSKYLEKGLDPNFHSDLGETPLTIASSLLEPREMIMNLYSGGAHLDFRSRDSLTPMHKAAQLDNDKALNILLELGGFADVKDSKNLTPLFYAMLNASSIKCVELLLYNGSMIGCKDDNNWQEIHYACKLGLSQHLDHLIYYGADLNARNNSGNTALHICAIHKQESCARILLFRGADKSIRNLSNQTAFDSAMITGNQTIADLIDKHKTNEIVPIKDKPQFNLKRRSVYLDGSGSNYGTMYSNSTSITNISANNSLTKSSVSTINQPWNNTTTSTTMNGYNTTTSLRSRSMPKLEHNSVANSALKSNQQQKNSDLLNHNKNVISTTTTTTTSNTTTVINSGSSSPASRSRSISSDDHGIGSASLSQLSGSPNIEYSYPRKRLYASIPDRKFICIKSYKPMQAGELELRKGDIVEIISVGEQGYWEGRSNSLEGWFPSDCVEEIQLPKDYNDSLVVKRKTLLDLITQSDYNVPRTVVLQRGKKGYGFVLRGAKVTDKKFEPTTEIPALQFLENVDKSSNADRAGLKPLDFVLEINGIDVTCRTHDDCVKLIKKSGDTLAMKVLTVSYTNSKQSLDNNIGNHYASTSVLPVPSQPPIPSIIGTQSPSATLQYNKNVKMTPSPTQKNSQLTQSSSSSSFLSIPQDYNDGTKSLPNKNKPIPPKRHPNTSLSNIDSSTCMTSFIYSSNTISKSTTNLSLYSSSSVSSNKINENNINNNNNNNNQENINIDNNSNNTSNNNQHKYNSSINLNSISTNALTSNSSSLLTTSSISSSLSANINNNDEMINNNKEQIFENNNYGSNDYQSIQQQQQQQQQQQSNINNNNTKILKKSISVNSDNTSYMNFVLAQIDELDKTLAEYDTLNGNGINYGNNNNNNNNSVSSKNKIIVSNDDNAASIRTRVPVRKPGIDMNDNNFQTMVSNGSMKLQQKTYSVPNLAQQQHQQESNKAAIINNETIYQRQTSNGSNDTSDTLSVSSNSSSTKLQKKGSLIKNHQKSSFNNKNNLINGSKHSPSSDTLIYDDQKQNGKIDEPEIDYNDDEYIDKSNSSSDYVNNKTVIPTPPPPPPISILSTFNNNNNPNSNNNNNNNNNKSSPLTPRQLKQRNSAKRSISRSSSVCNINETINENEPSQMIETSQPPPPPPLPSTSLTPPQNTKVNSRASSQPPITPTRTTPTLVYVTNNNNNNNSNKQEHLNDAIKRAAAEHVIKRQNQENNNTNGNQLISTQPVIKSQTFVNGLNQNGNVKQLIEQNNSKWPPPPSPQQQQQQQQSLPLQSAVIRNELEKAIENRIKRVNNPNLAVNEVTPQQAPNTVLIQNGVVNKISTFNKQNNSNNNIYENSQDNNNNINLNMMNKRNLPRDPPPPPPIVPLNRNNNNRETVELPPPPPPPSSTTPLTTTAQIALNIDNNNLPPPPSPTQLNRLNKMVNIPPVIKTVSPTKQNLPSPTQTIIDPRTSSDFGALIAKKAAEKRAKFHEARPSVNAVTFQADGSKVFSTNTHTQIQDDNENSNLTTTQINGHDTSSPIKQQFKQNGNMIKKPLTVTTNNNNLNTKLLVNNNAAELVAETSQQNKNLNDTNLIYINRNESFINTASKLLEKVKQNQGTTTVSNLNQQLITTNNLQVLPSKNQINNNSRKK